jgi:hypothetical protein
MIYKLNETRAHLMATEVLEAILRHYQLFTRCRNARRYARVACDELARRSQQPAPV